MLGSTYRFTVLNSLGQTIALSSIVVKSLRWKFDSTGGLVFDSEATEFSYGLSLATANYASGTTRDNSSTKWIGGVFTVTVTSPASSSGEVTVYFDRSTDGGTTWDTNGLGCPVASLYFSSATTQSMSFSL